MVVPWEVCCTTYMEFPIWEQSRRVLAGGLIQLSCLLLPRLQRLPLLWYYCWPIAPFFNRGYIRLRRFNLVLRGLALVCLLHNLPLILNLWTGLLHAVDHNLDPPWDDLRFPLKANGSLAAQLQIGVSTTLTWLRCRWKVCRTLEAVDLTNST